MSPGSIDSLERMRPAELIGLVGRLVGEVERLGAQNEKLSEAVARLRVENQSLKDEIARLKHLPPRPPFKPSGMEKATDRPAPQAEVDNRSRRRRGKGVSKLSIDREVKLTVAAPPGSRFKGYEGHHRSGLDAEARDDALSAGALGDADGRDPDRAPDCRRGQGLWPASASLRAGASRPGADDLRADRRAFDRLGRRNLQAAGGAAHDRQAFDVQGRGRSGVAGLSSRARPSSPSTTPGRAMPARPVSPPRLAPTGSPPSAPERANRGWRS
jgi:hypothetical protein